MFLSIGTKAPLGYSARLLHESVVQQQPILPVTPYIISKVYETLDLTLQSS